MLKTIQCPSYIQTYQKSEDGSVQFPVVIVPHDQWHSMMVEQLSNNRKIIEVNTILDDLVRIAESSDAIDRVRSLIRHRVVPYLMEDGQ